MATAATTPITNARTIYPSKIFLLAAVFAAGATLLGRRRVRPTRRLVGGAGARHLLLQPQAMVLARPVDVDLTRAHRLEGAFHADRTDVDMAKHRGDKQHRNDAV